MASNRERIVLCIIMTGVLASVLGCLSMVMMQELESVLWDTNSCITKFESGGASESYDDTSTSAKDHFSMIPCHVIFNIHEYDICLDVPSFYYCQNPDYFTRKQTYFTILDHVNYTKFKQCIAGDYILYINKLNTAYLNSFWLIS
jgi:hypothetical protein